MGKAAVDLPDPLQLTSSDGGRHKPLTSTDDLLAQLAGEEIDRLLAEVDEGSSAPAAVAEAPAASRPRPIDLSPPAVIPEPRPAADLDASAPASPASPTTDDAEAEPDLARGAADLATELDEIFGSAKPPLTPPIGPGGIALDPPASAPGMGLDETSAAERAGLGGVVGSAVATVAAPVAKTPVVAPAKVDKAASEAGPLPVYLKPLEWINAPLEACPQPVRDFVGKVAIITLVNAAAILLYVVLFRRG
jgi:hypothetical protein